jgi:hypothetical protein
MMRLVLVVALGFMVGDASARVRPRRAVCYTYPPPIYVPVYPLTPAVWGAPEPKPLPAAPAPRPVVKPPAGIREEKESDTPPKPPDKPKEADSKDKDTPRIPKVTLPPLPGDPPSVPPKREPAADRGKAVEQFFIPADPKRAEPRAEVKVGFFNHSDRAIVLQVNGEAVRLPSEEYVTLRLPRKFSWAEKGDTETDVAVPPEADGIEIVIRK